MMSEYRKPTNGEYRVIGVDTFDHTDWVEGDFSSLAQAMAHITRETIGKQMLKMHVYDRDGKHVADAGEF